MDREQSERTTDEHMRAKNKIERAEAEIREALKQIEEVASHLKQSMGKNIEPHDFPVDDNAPGDTEEALRGSEERLASSRYL